MALSVIKDGLDTSFLDVECRLEGCRVDWAFVANIYKAEKSGVPIKKETYDGCTLEALNFYKKKRLCVALKFAKCSQHYTDPSIYSIEMEALENAKKWVLEASPIEWEGMMACLEYRFMPLPSMYSLEEARELYESLL